MLSSQWMLLRQCIWWDAWEETNMLSYIKIRVIGGCPPLLSSLWLVRLWHSWLTTYQSHSVYINTTTFHQHLTHIYISCGVGCTITWNYLTTLWSVICSADYQVTAFQILLCLEVCCVGVSVIWCATLGWVIMLLNLHLNTRIQINENRGYIINAAKVVIGTDTLAIFYNAMTHESITTIAHVCAIMLGIFLWIVMDYLLNHCSAY